MDDVEGFDAGFFGYRPREADIADPQQRVFLEVCHTALQHAGYDPARYEGAIGVYGGSGPVAYHFRNVYENSRVRAAVGDMAIETNNNLDYLATHVAHALGLEGPAVSMVTACSTSLVAIHSACQALASGDCSMAIAGGVNILLPTTRGRSGRRTASTPSTAMCGSSTRTRPAPTSAPARARSSSSGTRTPSPTATTSKPY